MEEEDNDANEFGPTSICIFPPERCVKFTGNMLIGLLS